MLPADEGTLPADCSKASQFSSTPPRDILGQLKRYAQSFSSSSTCTPSTVASPSLVEGAESPVGFRAPPFSQPSDGGPSMLGGVKSEEQSNSRGLHAVEESSLNKPSVAASLSLLSHLLESAGVTDRPSSSPPSGWKHVDPRTAAGGHHASPAGMWAAGRSEGSAADPSARMASLPKSSGPESAPPAVVGGGSGQWDGTRTGTGGHCSLDYGESSRPWEYSSGGGGWEAQGGAGWRAAGKARWPDTSSREQPSLVTGQRGVPPAHEQNRLPTSAAQKLFPEEWPENDGGSSVGRCGRGASKWPKPQILAAPSVAASPASFGRGIGGTRGGGRGDLWRKHKGGLGPTRSENRLRSPSEGRGSRRSWSPAAAVERSPAVGRGGMFAGDAAEEEGGRGVENTERRLSTADEKSRMFAWHEPTFEGACMLCGRCAEMEDEAVVYCWRSACRRGFHVRCLLSCKGDDVYHADVEMCFLCCLFVAHGEEHQGARNSGSQRLWHMGPTTPRVPERMRMIATACLRQIRGSMPTPRGVLVQSDSYIWRISADAVKKIKDLRSRGYGENPDARGGCSFRFSAAGFFEARLAAIAKFNRVTLNPFRFPRVSRAVMQAASKHPSNDPQSGKSSNSRTLQPLAGLGKGGTSLVQRKLHVGTMPLVNLMPPTEVCHIKLKKLLRVAELQKLYNFPDAIAIDVKEPLDVLPPWMSCRQPHEMADLLNSFPPAPSARWQTGHSGNDGESDGLEEEEALSPLRKGERGRRLTSKASGVDRAKGSIAPRAKDFSRKRNRVSLTKRDENLTDEDAENDSKTRRTKKVKRVACSFGQVPLRQLPEAAAANMGTDEEPSAEVRVSVYVFPSDNSSNVEESFEWVDSLSNGPTLVESMDFPDIRRPPSPVLRPTKRSPTVARWRALAASGFRKSGDPALDAENFPLKTLTGTRSTLSYLIRHPDWLHPKRSVFPVSPLDRQLATRADSVDADASRVASRAPSAGSAPLWSHEAAACRTQENIPLDVASSAFPPHQSPHNVVVNQPPDQQRQPAAAWQALAEPPVNKAMPACGGAQAGCLGCPRCLPCNPDQFELPPMNGMPSGIPQPQPSQRADNLILLATQQTAGPPTLQHRFHHTPPPLKDPPDRSGRRGPPVHPESHQAQLLAQSRMPDQQQGGGTEGFAAAGFEGLHSAVFADNGSRERQSLAAGQPTEAMGTIFGEPSRPDLMGGKIGILLYHQMPAKNEEKLEDDA